MRDYWKRGYEVVKQAAGDNIVVGLGDASEDVDVRVSSPRNHRLRLTN